MSPWQLFVDKAEPQEVQAVGHYWSPLLCAVRLPIFTARRTVILSRKIGSVKERDQRHKATAVRKQFLSNGDNLWPPVTVVSGIAHMHRHTEEKRCRMRLGLNNIAWLTTGLSSTLAAIDLFAWTEHNRRRTFETNALHNQYLEIWFSWLLWIDGLYFSCSLTQMRSLTICKFSFYVPRKKAKKSYRIDTRTMSVNKWFFFFFCLFIFGGHFFAELM